MSQLPNLRNDILELIFNAVAIAGVAENPTAAGAALANLQVSLHTVDPGTGTDSQAANEVSYTGYARVGVARTTAGWRVAGDTVTPVAAIVFPTPTGADGAVATHMRIGTAATGAGRTFYTAKLSSPIKIVTGTAPRIEPGENKPAIVAITP